MSLSPQGCPLACPAQAASGDTFPVPFPGFLSATVPKGSPGHPDPNQDLRGMHPALLGTCPIGWQKQEQQPGTWRWPGGSAKGLQMDGAQTPYTLFCVLLVNPGLCV